MARASVLHCYQDNENSFLDTRVYKVEFLGIEVNKLKVSVIAKSTKVQCNVNGSKYLLEDSFIDY